MPFYVMSEPDGPFPLPVMKIPSPQLPIRNATNEAAKSKAHYEIFRSPTNRDLCFKASVELANH